LRSYSRATTLAKMLDDMYMVHQWTTRKTLIGMARCAPLRTQVSEIALGLDSAEYTEDDVRGRLNMIADEAATAAGTARANEFGTAVHEWTAYVDAGLISVHRVPETFRPWVIRHLELLHSIS
jgi:hypothetical protein